MQKLRQRLYMLERLSPFQPRPIPLALITDVALQSLPPQDLDMLQALSKEQASDLPPRELSDLGAAACAAWETALATETRLMGLQRELHLESAPPLNPIPRPCPSGR